MRKRERDGMAEHTKDCRCWDCLKQPIKHILPGGREVICDTVVIDHGGSKSYFLSREAWEGPAFMLS